MIFTLIDNIKLHINVKKDRKKGLIPTKFANKLEFIYGEKRNIIGGDYIGDPEKDKIFFYIEDDRISRNYLKIEAK